MCWRFTKCWRSVSARLSILPAPEPAPLTLSPFRNTRVGTVCLYFQVHQPYRLKDYSFFRIGSDHNYGATQQNFSILQRIADNCYLPANELMLKLIDRHEGKFKICYSVSGTALEQMAQFRPDVLESFRALADTGCVEFLNETQYHSLAYLFSETEFIRQIQLHKRRIKELLGYTCTSFRNTELIYDNSLAEILAPLGYEAVLAEGVDRYLKNELSPNHVQHAGTSGMACLLRNYRLSDDIAFRFTDTSWPSWPLTADTYAGWLKAILTQEGGETVNIFLDYETFGEHRKRETGIFDFMESLPKQVLALGQGFATPTELARTLKADGPRYDVPAPTSWADAERDLGAWTADNMQKDALNRCYALEKKIMRSGDPNVLEVWGRLQTSDHFYYMSTKYWRDPVHQAFSPYKNPYDAYINYMNVLTDFEELVG